MTGIIHISRGTDGDEKKGTLQNSIGTSGDVKPGVGGKVVLWKCPSAWADNLG